MTKKPLMPCGTNAAFQRHILHNEVPCRPCLLAHQQSQKMYQDKRRATHTRPRPRRTSGLPSHSRNCETGWWEDMCAECRQAAEDTQDTPEDDDL